MALWNVIFVDSIQKLLNLLCLSDKAIHCAWMLSADKYLCLLIINTPFLCSQSEDVDLLLVSGSDAQPNNKKKIVLSAFYMELVVEIKLSIPSIIDFVYNE